VNHFARTFRQLPDQWRLFAEATIDADDKAFGGLSSGCPAGFDRMDTGIYGAFADVIFSSGLVCA